MDYFEIEKYKMNNDEDYYDVTFANTNKKSNKNSNLSTSIEYKIPKKFFDEKLNVNNKVNIYQRLFDLKMNNLIKSTRNRNKSNSNDNLPNSPKKKNNKYINIHEMFSDDETVNNLKSVKINGKNTKRNNNINISNIDISQNQNKEYFDDDITSIKSKKSKNQRNNSLNSSVSNNNDRFSQIYERFIENQQKHKEKIEHLKKLKEEKEKINCYFSPKINKFSEDKKEDKEGTELHNLYK